MKNINVFSLAAGNMRTSVLEKVILEKVEVPGMLAIDEESILKEGCLFHTCGHQAQEVHVRLTLDIFYLYEDEDYLDCVDQIDFRSITGVKLVNDDTFELYTALSVVHLFSMYDSQDHTASSYVDIIEKECQITRVAETESSSESLKIEETESEYAKVEVEPIIVEDTPWYYYPWIYLCPCWIKRRFVTIDPEVTSASGGGTTNIQEQPAASGTYNPQFRLDVNDQDLDDVPDAS